ncbi:MAG TPA: ankyrin repeat domain-containing protein [Caulobacteraceae bacterium]|nr:ankyrin repeat domain-containing protein [Caulobacteraceae bacterium]
MRAHDAEAVGAGLAASPQLLGCRNQRGYGWLHLCCSVDIGKPGRSAAASIATAEALAEAGLGIDDVAFFEGEWRATPLWCAIGRGRNLALAEWLLRRGCNPNYSLYAAAFRDDFAAIRLLCRYGAEVDDRSAGETPFLGAVASSHFAAAEVLLELGADIDAIAPDGRTGLHMMLAKGSDPDWIVRVVGRGAGLDIPDRSGATARAMLARKKEPRLRRLAG